MTKKLRIDDLSVDSFEVSGEETSPRGTVQAHSAPNCFSGVPSCIDSCQDSCGLTCWQSCWPAECPTNAETCNCA